MKFEKGGQSMTLIERCQKMLDELGIPITSFCRKVGISASYFYACKKGTLNFSKEVDERINDYLTKYGF